MARTKIEEISALAELERLGVKWEPAGANEVKVKCPLHDDATPSVAVNTQSNLWVCYASQCGAKGDIVSLLSHVAGVERSTMLLDLSTRYDLEGVRVIRPETVEKFHARIWDAGPLLEALRARGVTDAMIRSARLGFHEGRITIPVYDRSWKCVDILRYLPGAPGPKKMRHTSGYGKPRVYQPEQIDKHESVWICGGPIKALVAASMLNPIGSGAISATGGEGTWEPEWSAALRGKHVYVCMDVDAAGRIASRKVAQRVHSSAASVKIIRLPLDESQHPKGDINDWVAKEGATSEHFRVLQEEASPWAPASTSGAAPRDGEDPEQVPLHRIAESNSVGRLVQFEAVASAMDTTPYLVPRRVGAMCTRDQPGCHCCPIMPMEPNKDDGFVELTVPPLSPGILEMVSSPKSAQRDGLRAALGIPVCKVVDFSVRDHHRVTDLRAAPQLNIGSDDYRNILQPVFSVGSALELNVPYRMTGTVYPHPKNQQAVALVCDAEETEDALSRERLTDADLVALEVFRPREWSLGGLDEKLSSLYADLEANVTRIYSRRTMHVAMDLAFHSVLTLPFDGRIVNGWANVLITGDSSQGKTEISTNLMRHYGAGERVECKNATVAGLLGGLQQLGTRWFVSWGVIPTHDRRLVVLEEVKGASTEVIAKLTDMRSSGIAEIPKIERKRAPARTRLVWISNPRSDRPVSTYSFGVEAIRELIGGLEDVRRFDAAVIASAGDVDPAEINRLSAHRPQVMHLHRHDLCRNLVVWSWTRRADDVEFEGDAERAALESAVGMCSKYTEEIPLVDRGTMRLKLARLGAALAARTYSTTGDGRLLVRKCHIEWVARWLDAEYSRPAFGYAAYSEAVDITNRVTDPKVVRACIAQTRHPRDLVRQLLYRDEVSLWDLADWCAATKDEAQKTMSLLVRKHALYRRGRAYVKSSGFIELLREMEKMPDVELRAHDPTEEF